MNIYFSPSFIRAYKRFAKINPQKVKKVKEAIGLFEINPKNPSLKTHKLTGYEKDTWSFSISYSLRIIYTSCDDGVIFIDIGNHDEVY